MDRMSSAKGTGRSSSVGVAVAGAASGGVLMLSYYAASSRQSRRGRLMQEKMGVSFSV